MNNISVVLLVILSFSLLLIGHEFGHFILAKINGVKVEEFAIGMGPLLFKIKGKETMYSLRLLPIGGYVKMLGEYSESEDSVPESEKDRSYIYKSPLRKLSIILAGPVMNLVIAVLIFCGLSLSHGYVSTVIREIKQGSPAETAGLKIGDKIVAINSEKFINWNEFIFKLNTTKNKEDMTFTVLRDGKEIDLSIKPKVNGNSIEIGIAPGYIKNPRFFEGISNGFKDTFSEIKQVMYSLGMLITGKASFKDLSGPVTIFKISGQAARAGLPQLLKFTAFLSVNLAIFNLIPFPALDGGAVIINLIEAITRKRINQDILAKINFVGFALLIILLIAVTFKDIFFPVGL